MNGKTPGMILRRLLWIVFKYFMLCLASFIAVLPIVSCVITAFKTPEEYANTNVMQLPKSWLYLTNFTDAWQKANMGRAFINSIIVLACVLIGSILIGVMLAYTLNRFRFHGNGLIRNLFLFASLLPGIAMQVSVYPIMTNLGFINHLWGYIIVMMGTDIISVTIFIQFFENISPALDESAIVDGCTYFGVFFKILFPLLKPAIITVMILKGVGTYSEYYMANLYLQNKDIRTRMVDPREGSEWFWELDAEGCPSVRKPLVEPWKCPYHNGRMCFEVIRRL